MNVYVINMDKDKERLEVLKDSLAKLKCKDKLKIVRIPAVDGKKIDINKFDISLRARSIFDEPRTSHESIDCLGHIGCYLSHVNCWERVVRDDDDYALICEDDAKFTTEFCSHGLDLWNSLYLKHKNKPLVLMCNYVDVFYKPTYEKKDIMKANGRFFGTGAYFLNKQAADVLLKYCFPIEVQVDSYMAFLSKLHLGGINIFHTKDHLIPLQDVKSTIDHSKCPSCWLPDKWVNSKHKTTIEYITLAAALIAALVSIGLYLKKTRKI